MLVVTFLSHLIWKDYVLYWDFDFKSWHMAFFLPFNLWRNTGYITIFLIKILLILSPLQWIFFQFLTMNTKISLYIAMVWKWKIVTCQVSFFSCLININVVIDLKVCMFLYGVCHHGIRQHFKNELLSPYNLMIFEVFWSLLTFTIFL